MIVEVGSERDRDLLMRYHKGGPMSEDELSQIHGQWSEAVCREFLRSDGPRIIMTRGGPRFGVSGGNIITSGMTTPSDFADDMTMSLCMFRDANGSLRPEAVRLAMEQLIVRRKAAEKERDAALAKAKESEREALHWRERYERERGRR